MLNNYWCHTRVHPPSRETVCAEADWATALTWQRCGRGAPASIAKATFGGLVRGGAAACGRALCPAALQAWRAFNTHH